MQKDNRPRIDLRISEELYQELIRIATDKLPSKVNAISGKPELTPVIVRLLELGIKYLDSNPDNIPDNMSDSVSTRIDELEKKLNAIALLEERLAAIEAAISPIPVNAIAVEEETEETQEDDLSEETKKLIELFCQKHTTAQTKSNFYKSVGLTRKPKTIKAKAVAIAESLGMTWKSTRPS